MTIPEVRYCKYCNCKFSAEPGDGRECCGPKHARLFAERGARVTEAAVTPPKKTRAPAKRLSNAEFYRRFGELVNRERKELDLKISELAEITGITATTISSVEKGVGGCSLLLAITICDALGVQIPKGWSGADGAMERMRTKILDMKKARVAALRGELEDAEKDLRISAARFKVPVASAQV